MVRFEPFTSGGYTKLLWVAAACALLAACGEPACPAGSTSINGRCEPSPACRPGEILDGGECTNDDSSIRSDAGDEGPDGGERGDASEPSDGPDASDDGSLDGSVGPVDQDGAVTESGNPLCRDLDCGDHGGCVVIDEEPRCTCSDGYEGELCDVCEEGYMPQGDECVIEACAASDAPDCGSHGECEEVEDLATCVCEHPYTGDECDECSEGFALLPNGNCEADCGDCGAHALCNAELPVPACECAVGYAQGASACIWVGDGATGGISDGELADPAAWTLTGATMTSGSVTFENSGSGASCEIGALEQVITMPALEDAEPMAIEIDISTGCSAASPELCPSLLLEVGDAVTHLAVQGGTSSQTLRTCLGAAAYGGEIALRIRPSILGSIVSNAATVFSCDDDAWPTIRAVRIESVTDSTCAQQSWVPSGLFNASAGWTLSNASVAGGLLTINASGRATANVVVPSTEQMASPAVNVRYTDGASLAVLIDGSISLGRITAPENVEASQIRCLPGWARGTGHTLTLSASVATTVTEVSIVNRPECGDGSFDASFERTPLDEAPQQGSWAFGNGAPRVTAAAAHQGSKGLRMNQATSSVVGVARVPRADGVRRPAFQMWHRKTTTGSVVTASLTPVVSGTFSLTGTAWTERTNCLPRAYEGQLVLFQLLAFLMNGPAELQIDQMGPVLRDDCD